MIYFNGDSNVAGTELADPDKGMTGSLARRLDLPYENHAFGGASNDFIYDTTMESLFDRTTRKIKLKRRPSLVVIGWTQVNRIQWFLVDQWQSGEFWEINNIGVGIPVPDQFKTRYDFWQNHINKDGHWRIVMNNYWHNKIYNLHTILQYFSIPHVFFNAFDPFSTENLLPDQQQWHGCFMTPYDDGHTYIPWCFSNGYQEVTPGWHHFREDAQTAWADVMFEHIKANRIL